MEKLGKLEKLASLTYPDGQPVVSVQRAKQPRPESFPFRQEIGALLGRIRSGLTQDSTTIIHVTSARSGEGVSTVARELAHAAATMPWCRPLLLDRNAGGNDQGQWFGVELPDLISGYDQHGHLSVVAIEVGGATFHAASISPNAIIDDIPSKRASDRRAHPGEVMRVAYNLVIVDCPPVLDSSHFLLLVQQPAEALLVVRAEHTRLSATIEAKEQLAYVGCEVSGVVMNQWRRRAPWLHGRFS